MQKEIETFNNVQESIKKELTEFNEKLAQHSLAVVSLTMPFVGFLASRTGETAINFSQSFLFLPLYIFLFFGWFCLIITLIFGVSYRKRIADYSYSTARVQLMTAMQNYGAKYTKKEMKEEKNEMEKLFKPIKEANRYLLLYFTAGIISVLLFVMASTSQLIRVDSSIQERVIKDFSKKTQ